jgi:predicted ribosomally synthesized peptide with SipW-like signal peptide
MSATTHSRRLAAAGLVAAAAVGVVGGAAFALWQDQVDATGRIASGVVVFGAGAPAAKGSLADYSTAPGDAPVFTFGSAAATTLFTQGSVAVPIQVDALSQGNRGLSYELDPSITGGVFGASDVIVFPVASAAACTVGAAPATQPPLTSTPVSAAYSGAYDDTVDDLTSEYWCVVAQFDRTLYDYDNQVTARGSWSPGSTVQDEDTWAATVTSDLDPAVEPDHTITFDYTTFHRCPAPPVEPAP